MWDPQRSTFSEHFTCYFIDLPGYGSSPTPTEPFSMAGALATFVESAIGGPAAVVGSSFGAGVSIETAALAPALVGPLVLANRATWEETEPSALLRAVWNQADEAWDRGDRDRAIDLEIEAWVDGPGRQGRPADPHVRGYFRAVDRSIWERQATEPMPATIATPSIDYAQIAQPVLVIDGPFDMPDVHHTTAAMRGRLPNVEYASIPDTAHFPNRERPAAFDRVVLDFLRRTWR